MSAWRDGTPGVVDLPDGRRVRGVGLRRGRGDVPPPDLGVYLLGRDPRVAWPYLWVRWRDFGLPRDDDAAVEALREAHRRSESERVEIGCGGGVGRTGTALAVLAAWSGVPTDEAVGWVRRSYDRRAVETRRQRRWVRLAASRRSSSLRTAGHSESMIE